MFLNIKNDELDNPTVRTLVSESAWDKSKDATDRKVAEFRSREDMDIYGWIENDEFLAVCGVEIHSNWVEILNIAVNPNDRKRGIGNSLIISLQQRYKMPIKAETDDDAVGFYRKCGFETEAFIKTYPNGECKRYKCVLHVNQ
jgi:ribosomal protein S18 acetylase RimI-like enzyme